jgi:hypothetical protein
LGLFNDSEAAFWTDIDVRPPQKTTQKTFLLIMGLLSKDCTPRPDKGPAAKGENLNPS